MHHKAYAYVHAVYVALVNWTEGAAQGLVEHGCDNGLDACRRSYNRYIPGADDVQQLLIEEFMRLKPVSEQGVDGLFTEVERIMEWYTKTDVNGESMNAKWVRAALIRNLPTGITQHLAIELRTAQTIDAAYTLAMVYPHDHNTGLPRGQAPAQLYPTEESNDKDETLTQTKSDETRPDDRHNKKEDPCT